MRACDLGEDELIRRLVGLTPQPSGDGERAGDDCAILDSGGDDLVLLKTDALVEGVHYRSGEGPERVGWKAVARVVSDFAATGGKPSEFLVTLAISKGVAVSWLEGLYQGMGRCMSEFGGRLVGGETTSLPDGAPIVISVTGVGRVARGQVVLRSGGQPGDLLAVTGALGGSLIGKHLDFLPRLKEGEMLAAGRHAKAMMDLSDGLAKDLPRLAMASGCGFRLDREKVPCNTGCSVAQAIGDGEDYELLFAVSPERWEEFHCRWHQVFSETPVTLIGDLVCKDESDEFTGGWDHFLPNA